MTFHIPANLHDDLQTCDLYGEEIALFIVIVPHTKWTTQRALATILFSSSWHWLLTKSDVRLPVIIVITTLQISAIHRFPLHKA